MTESTAITDRTALELTSWRRQVGELYASVRAQADPAGAHQLWRSGRDHLFRTHPQSPLTDSDALRETGLSYFAYDPTLRFELPMMAPDAPQHLSIPTGGGESTELRLLGHLELPSPVRSRIDVWWMEQYGGGIFIPFRDGTAGDTSYGGGRYLLDTAKGADLGGSHHSITVDLNFLYHPSCRYNPAWVCPLAPPGNTVKIAVRAGEML